MKITLTTWRIHKFEGEGKYFFRFNLLPMIEIDAAAVHIGWLFWFVSFRYIKEGTKLFVFESEKL